jgi:hypothetical protein
MGREKLLSVGDENASHAEDFNVKSAILALLFIIPLDLNCDEILLSPVRQHIRHRYVFTTYAEISVSSCSQPSVKVQQSRYLTALTYNEASAATAQTPLLTDSHPVPNKPYCANLLSPDHRDESVWHPAPSSAVGRSSFSMILTPKLVQQAYIRSSTEHVV